jgi:hypothetical protein
VESRISVLPAVANHPHAAGADKAARIAAEAVAHKPAAAVHIEAVRIAVGEGEEAAERNSAAEQAEAAATPVAPWWLRPSRLDWRRLRPLLQPLPRRNKDNRSSTAGHPARIVDKSS